MTMRASIVAAFIATIFALAVVAATLTRHDRGMIAVGKCQALTWPVAKLPLFVETDNLDLARPTAQAVDWWAARLQPSFVFAGVDVDAASNGTIIAVKFSEALEGHARPRFNTACQIIGVEIDIPEATPADEIDRAVTHELGHALGLADDTGPESSVMFHRALSGGFDLTSSDLALLRATYGGGE